MEPSYIGMRLVIFLIGVLSESVPLCSQFPSWKSWWCAEMLCCFRNPRSWVPCPLSFKMLVHDLISASLHICMGTKYSKKQWQWWLHSAGRSGLRKVLAVPSSIPGQWCGARSLCHQVFIGPHSHIHGRPSWSTVVCGIGHDLLASVCLETLVLHFFVPVNKSFSAYNSNN